VRLRFARRGSARGVKQGDVARVPQWNPSNARIAEELVKKRYVLAVACIAIAGARDARAQEQQSFRTIMGKGYEIKSVTFARGEATDNREIFVVTLQKDKSVAVCYFAAANWINLSPAALEDSKRCDVR
jgi:hypothetical protein